MGKMGCGLLVLLAILVLIFGGNELLGEYLERCALDDSPVECLKASEEESKPEGTVTATGTYAYKDYSVTVVANIPLEGGNVTGSVSGACDGKVKGSFSGQNNGGISGAMTGACSPFFVNIPASAEYSGTVNKDSKTVPISFTGKGAGITHAGSMSLSY